MLKGMARRHLCELRAERAAGVAVNPALQLKIIGNTRRMAARIAIIERPTPMEPVKQAIEWENDDMTDTCIRAHDLTNALIETGQLSPSPNWSRDFCLAIARQYYGHSGSAADVDSLGERLLAYCRSLATDVKTEGQLYYEAAHEAAIAGRPGDTYAPWESLTPEERQTQEESARVLSIALAAYKSVHGGEGPNEFERDRWLSATEFMVRTWLSIGLNSKNGELRAESFWLASLLQGAEWARSPIYEDRRKRLLAVIAGGLARITAEIGGNVAND